MGIRHGIGTAACGSATVGAPCESGLRTVGIALIYVVSALTMLCF